MFYIYYLARYKKIYCSSFFCFLSRKRKGVRKVVVSEKNLKSGKMVLGGFDIKTHTEGIEESLKKKLVNSSCDEDLGDINGGLEERPLGHSRKKGGTK